MSLIVGRVLAREQIYLFADTEVTYRNEERRPVTNGCLKLYRLSARLALGFAGDIADFDAFLPTVRAATTPEQIVLAAESAYAAGARFDVLVAAVGSQHIHTVKSGVRQITSAGFIGDAHAYGRYQQVFHDGQENRDGAIDRATITARRLPEPVNEVNYMRMFDSFVDVVDSRAFPGVGGLVVPLCTDHGAFEYINYAAVVSDILRLEDFTQVAQAIRFGTAEGGGYSLEFSPALEDPSALGFYIPPAGFGAVFSEGAAGIKYARLLPAKTPAHWSLATRAALGHEIRSGFLRADHCGIAGEELISAQRFEEAVFCYELSRDTDDFEDRPGLRDRFYRGYAHALIGAGRRNEALEVLLRRSAQGGFSPSSAALLEQLRGSR